MDEKAVIILSETLPVGLGANVSAVLAMALGKAQPELVELETASADAISFAGITRIPLPVLTAAEAQLKEAFTQAREMNFSAAVTDAALATKSHADYQELLAATPFAEVRLHGILLYGPKKAVNRIAGRLPLLR